MNLQEQIRDYLKRAGKQVISLVEEDIEFPSSHIESDKKIISATTSWKKATFFLYLLTSKRIITPEKNKKKKNRISYDLNAISNLIVNRKFLSVEVVFTHLLFLSIALIAFNKSPPQLFCGRHEINISSIDNIKKSHLS
ncbi:hypothetical protein [Lysinibacillus fusiformis]|uniref:hypothetical protein n=1 Tax=Lysinibacillus fusiformis TaxID=28031 RepID=UPI0036ED7D2F